MKVSEAIRKEIEKCGWSRYELAKRAGVEQATLSRFMAGKCGLAMRTVDKLADVLGLELKKRKGKK
jgi:ribosome-binding protein aMBF1 (putative translation factor)